MPCQRKTLEPATATLTAATTPKPRRERKSTVKATVIRSDEAIDFAAWIERYARTLVDEARSRAIAHEKGALDTRFPPSSGIQPGDVGLSATSPAYKRLR